MSDNPYQSPEFVGEGIYEWPLWRRIVYAVIAISIVYLLCGAVASWQLYSRSAPEDATIVEKVRAFVTDWRSVWEN